MRARPNIAQHTSSWTIPSGKLKETLKERPIYLYHLTMSGNCSSERCCPYGGFLAVPVIVTLFATLFTWAATFNCSFYFIDDSRGVGLWTVQGPTAFFGDHVCYGWDDSFQSAGLSLDTPMRFARGLSLPASLASLYIFTSMLIPSCNTMPARFIKSITFTMFLLGLLCILCLVALASDNCSNAQDCNMGVAGILCIIASILWVVAGGLTLRLQERSEQVFRPVVAALGALPVDASVPSAQQVEQKTVSSDGTITTITTLTVNNPDGSKTVTETVETSPPIETSIEMVER